jgi:predicted enzyme related to lactoylglutathione lyase
MRQHGTVAWTELLSTDPEAAKAFYEKTLGWTFERFPLGDAPYWVIKAGDTMVGGLGGMASADHKSDETYWLTSLEVTDIDRRFAEALTLGATAITPPHDVPGIGRVATLRDPTGGVVSWMTGAE